MLLVARTFLYIVAGAALSGVVFGSPGPRDLLDRPVTGGQCSSEDASCSSGRAWTLWYEDEVYEDCDDPTFGGTLASGAVPRGCTDQYARGPSFDTAAACASAGQMLEERMPVMSQDDMVCMPAGSRPKKHAD
jgi:hypothetical protein